MRLAKACAIFMNIGSKDYSIEEKGAAIQMVCDMPTHNGITKDRMLDVIRWLLNLLFVTGVKAEHSNADRIRAMSDGELEKFINHFNICDLRSNDECKMSYCACCEVCVMDWLKQPAEEGR